MFLRIFVYFLLICLTLIPIVWQLAAYSGIEIIYFIYVVLLSTDLKWSTNSFICLFTFRLPHKLLLDCHILVRLRSALPFPQFRSKYAMHRIINFRNALNFCWKSGKLSGMILDTGHYANQHTYIWRYGQKRGRGGIYMKLKVDQQTSESHWTGLVIELQSSEHSLIMGALCLAKYKVVLCQHTVGLILGRFLLSLFWQRAGRIVEFLSGRVKAFRVPRGGSWTSRFRFVQIH